MDKKLVEFTIWLTAKEIAGLKQLAKRELRLAEAHLRYVLRRELFYAQLLPGFALPVGDKEEGDG